MKLNTPLRTIVVSLLTLSLVMVSVRFVKAQPTIGSLIFQVTTSPCTDLLTLSIDIYADLTTPFGFNVRQANGLLSKTDITTLVNEEKKVTYTPGFHVTYFGFNLHRPILDDVNFRHALVHALDEQRLISAIFNGIVSPIHSLVPPAQGGWMAVDVPKHPFNPGDPLGSGQYPEDHSSCGILRYRGYTYHGTGYGDLNGYWTDPNGNPLPTMHVFSPPWPSTSATLVMAWVVELNRIGLNNIVHEPKLFGVYSHLVFDQHDFDIYFMGEGVDRFPDHLYAMCHSTTYVPGSDHAVGLQDPHLDDLLEELKFGLDHDAKMEACHEAQRRLHDPEKTSWACAYIPIYSAVCYTSEQPTLFGKILSAARGEYNIWTLLNMYWNTPTPTAPVTWGIPEPPDSFNPCAASTSSELAILGSIIEGLIAVNPYTHIDVPWIASNWMVEAPITETITLDSDNTWMGYLAGETFDIVDGMKVTFQLRDHVYWQDGNLYTANDAEFCLEFLRENQIPRYKSAWQHIVDVQVTDYHTFTVYSRVTSQFLLYDWAALAAMLPPQVWWWLNGQPLSVILGWDPTSWINPGTGPRPTPTALFGTGPFEFLSYNPTAMFATLNANPIYWRNSAEIDDQLAEMFHSCGDVDRNGEVWAIDKKRWGDALWSEPGDPNWDPDADVYPDNKIDFVDGIIISIHWGDTREVDP